MAVELLDQQRRNRCRCRVAAKEASKLEAAGAQPGRVEIEHRPIEHEAGDGRAGRGIAVGVERAAVERQVRARRSAGWAP